MDDHIAVIVQHPAGTGGTFAADDPFALRFQIVFDFFANSR